jgi:hypothetical protein
MSPRQRANTPIEFVRNILWSGFWDVYWHEGELQQAHKILTFATELIKRANLGFTMDDITKDDCEEDDRDAQTFMEYARGVAAAAKQSVQYYEEQLKSAHEKLSYAKMLYMRGNYTEFTMEETEQEAIDDLNSQQSDRRVHIGTPKLTVIA